MNNKEIKYKKKRRRISIVVAVSALVLVLCFVDVTSSWYKEQDSKVNTMALPYNMIKIVETYPGSVPITAGDSRLKVVSFTNTGNADSLIRCSYRESWISSEHKILSNTFIDSDGEIKDVVKKGFQWAKLWTEMDDGYFYYNSVLKAGETTQFIMDGIEINEDIPTEYASGEYDLEFRVDGVACMNNNIDGVDDFLGVTPKVDKDGNVEWKGN